ncbi:MAG: hypothetical protein PUK40_01140 [Actinomycetaceae bacterium]|nr:hypothetical protein [Arcanobacterium sp.]MDD7504546.1 hypothetical protein [Actinomycetaceae bacterium]MDY6143189.1 hypothetical protein [Arcanobacterium sp.]
MVPYSYCSVVALPPVIAAFANAQIRWRSAGALSELGEAVAPANTTVDVIFIPMVDAHTYRWVRT